MVHDATFMESFRICFVLFDKPVGISCCNFLCLCLPDNNEAKLIIRFSGINCQVTNGAFQENFIGDFVFDWLLVFKKHEINMMDRQPDSDASACSLALGVPENEVYVLDVLVSFC